jgi:DNA-binding IclR family transcriptional regulator
MRLPGAKADVLDVLEQLQGRPTTAAAIARVTGRSRGTVLKLLSRLRAEGAIATAAKRGSRGGFVAAMKTAAVRAC